METIIGLGLAGCRIADAFAEHSQYEAYKIDAGLEGENCFNMPKHASHEGYEKDAPDMTEFFGDVSGEILFVVGGAGTISGASLRILKQLRHCDINVLYIRPDIQLLGQTASLQEKMVYNVFQEYARSGVFRRLYLVSNPHLEELIGKVPIKGYFSHLNSTLINIMHMVNVFNHTEPEMSTHIEPLNAARISTLGVLDLEKNEEKILFPLNEVRERCYYYGIREEQLENDGELLEMVKRQVKAKKDEDTKVSYRIFSTQYDHNLCFFAAHSAQIQTEES